MNIEKAPANWKELDTLLWQRSFDAGTQRYKPYVAFRGLPKNYGNLRTGLQRLADPPLPAAELEKRERRLIDSFSMYAREHFSLGTSDWDVLLLAQHYRLPTRFLDWTSSPYAALFFATEDSSRDSDDGLIYCVERAQSNSSLPSPFKEILERQRTGLFSLEILKENFPCLEEFDKCPHDALIWFEPPSLSPRIVNQYAYFSVMPGVESSHSGWLERYQNWHWVIPIPTALKPEIRQRLQVMNITHRVMYPGLEGIAQWLKAYYSGS